MVELISERRGEEQRGLGEQPLVGTVIQVSSRRSLSSQKISNMGVWDKGIAPGYSLSGSYDV